MKKVFLLVSLMAVIVLGYCSHVVPVETAMKASQNFLSERVGVSGAKSMTLTLAYTEYSEEGTPLYYRFQVGDKGFMIVSATDLATPILAYSLESNFTQGTGVEFYCDQYKKDLAYLVKNPTSALATSNLWSRYLSDNFQVNAPKGNPCVEPLVTTSWTQETYYNTMCPMNPQADFDWDLRAPVGCVALTMANLLYYYRYPQSGYGAVFYHPVEYDDETGEVVYAYPALNANFGQAKYDYNHITNSLNSYNGELEKLIYHCGVSVRMGYGHDGSGSQSEVAMTSLQNHFNFSQQAQFQEITETVIADSLLYLWVNKAKAELDARRPLFFSGTSESAGGHAWIVDGYTTIADENGNNDTYFHVNWGWAGYDNGFFLINNQNTHGSGNFNAAGSEAMMTNMVPGDTNAVIKPAFSEERVTSSTGTISDGAGHMKYAQGSNRSWMIACPGATKYSFQFSKLKVKSGDKVTIYNGPTTASGVKQEFSGNYLMPACSQYSNVSGGQHGDYQGQTLPGAVSVTADSVLVVFTSAANSETDYGFVLDFEATSFSSNNSCAESSAITNSWNRILSDKANNELGSTEPYLPGKTCSWQLRVPYTVSYTLDFRKFDLKAGDFVDVYDYETPSHPTLIGHFDINNMPYGPFSIPSSRGYIKFATDNWQEGTGFELEYYQIAGIDQHSALDEVSVYPNPATNFVNVAITTEEAQTIAANIVDITGKVVYAEELAHNGGEQIFTLPLNNLAKGVYVINLTSKYGKTIQKFVIQ
ncbi:MAG: C10 family peptidase [Bacteroidales bacterium]|nr:C10 family peptidase [Bacteroidales bacterium]